MDNKIIIKKYENRRLYDATHSRYVNLDEVARAVQDGFDVQVLDASTGEDLTRRVMTQIIIEGAKSPNSAFPLDILKEMVVASGKASQESALGYMRTVADMYKNALTGLSQPNSPFEIMQKMMNSASGTHADQVASPPLLEGDSRPRDSKGQISEQDTELHELKRRIQELEAMVSKGQTSSQHKKRVRTPPTS